VDPSHVPPPSPPPICLKSLARDNKRTGVRRGRSRCRPSPASCAPTEFSHGSDPSYMPEAPVISDRSPFYSVRPTRSCSSVPKLETGTPKLLAWHRKSKNYSRVEFITRPTECPTQPRRMIDANRVYTFI
jgi:hypothetical protein